MTLTSTANLELRAFSELEAMTSATLEIEVGAPIALSFELSSDSLWLGTETTLSWQSVGGSELRIFLDDSDETICAMTELAEIAGSSCTWQPAVAGIFPITLSISNSSGVASSAATIFAADGPMILSFHAAPTIMNVGDEVSLGWRVHADPAGTAPTLRLTDDRGNSYDVVQDSEGVHRAALLEAGAYTLQLEASTDHPDSVSDQATVDLFAHPIPVVDFTASPEHFDDSVDESVSLAWTISDAVKVTLFRLEAGTEELVLEATEEQREEGSFDFVPREETRFRLVATNAIGTATSREVTITVAPLEVLVADATPKLFTQGQKIRLHWATRMADEVKIDLGTKNYLLEETDAPYLDLPDLGGDHVPLTDACGTIATAGCVELIFPDGFAFSFGGSSYGRAWVYTNGYIGFTHGTRPDSISVNQDFPTEPANAAISLAPFWDQLRWDVERYPTGNVHTALLEEDGEQIFVIQWRDIGQSLTAWRSASFNFEVVLRRDGSFDFRYGPQRANGTTIPFNTLAGDSATIGWQLPDRSDFGRLGYNGQLPLNGSPAHRSFSYSPLPALPLQGELVFAPFGPQASFPITVTATRDGVSHSKVVNLQVAQKPILELEPEAIAPHLMGEEFILGWRSSNAATLVVLDGSDSVRCTGTTQATLEEGFCTLSEETPGRHEYTVRVTGANDVALERKIAVDIFGAFGVAAFAADADSIEKGGDVLLRWEAFGGASITIYGNSTELFSGPGGEGLGTFLVSGVEEATEFRLVVENDVGATDEALVSVGLWDFEIGLQASATSVRPDDPVTITLDARRLDDGTPVSVYGLLPLSEVPGPADRYADISSHPAVVNHGINQSQTSIIVPIEFPPGFVFPYMGSEITQLLAFADGYVSFTPGATTTSSNQLLPIPPGVFGAVVHLAPFWDDLHPRGIGQMHSALLDDDTFAIQWSRFSTNGGTTNAAPQDLNFQIVLHRSGAFDFRYGTMAPHPTHRPTSGCFPNDCTTEVNGSAATIGYQFNDGTAGHSFHFGGTTPNIANLPAPGGGLSDRTLRYPTITGGGSFTFHPQKTETFSFCVAGASGPLCKDVRIEAEFGLRAAKISKEQISHGEAVTLSWESVGGKVLNILDGDLVVYTTSNLAEIDQGSHVLHPTKNTAYVVELLAGGRRETLQQVVEIDRFGLTAAATTSTGPGAPVTLSWNVSRSDPAASIQVIAPMEEIPNASWSTYDLSLDPEATQLIGANVDNQNVTLSFVDFSFPYFGTEHTSIRVATDGYLHWETSGTSTPGNQPIPNTTGSNHGKALAPFWEDLHTRQQGRVLAKKLGADRYVIQWSRMSLRWGSENTNQGDLNFLVILHRDGSFEFLYHFMDPPPNPATNATHCLPLSCERESNGSSATIGYQTPGGRAGHQIHFGGTNRALAQPTVPGGLSHRGWKFTPRTGTSGSVQVNPADSTHYKLCALDTVTTDMVCTPVLAVEVPWGIDLFQVSPDAPLAGQPVSVSWSVRGVDAIQILADGVPLATHHAPSVPLMGAVPHTPSGTTTYTILATSLDRTVTKEQVVALRAFDLTVTGPSTTAFPGEVVEVHWQLNQHLPGSIAMLNPMSELEIGPEQEGAFLDVSGLPGATQLAPNGSTGSAELTLPFTFPYLGTQQNRLRAYVGGYLSFTATQGGSIAENVPLPTSAWRTGEVHLAPFWDYLILRAGDSMWSYAPDASTLIIQWKQLSVLPSSSASARYDLNFQVVLRSDGSFEYRYGKMDPPPAPYSSPECGPTSCADEANGAGATIGYQSVDALHGSTLHIGSIAPAHQPFDWGDPDGPRAESLFPFSGGLSHRSFRYTPATSGSARIIAGRSSDLEVCGILGDFVACQGLRLDVVEAGEVMITEVMVDPSAGAPAQWIEVRNLTDETIDLQGFELRSNQGSHRIGSPLPIQPKAFATLASSNQVGFVPDYVYAGDVPLTRQIDTLELRAGTETISAVAWGTEWNLPRNQAISLDPAFHLSGVRENSDRSSWCVAGTAGSPGALGVGCVNPLYQSDPLSDRPFIDIAGTGTRFHDVEGFGRLARLPATGFKVKLFGQEHSRIWVATNGVISLIDTTPIPSLGIIESPGRLPLLTSLNLGPHIAAFWTILDCSSDCRFFYERREIDGADVLILQWDRFRVAPAAHPASTPAELQGFVTFQLQLWANGEIVVAFDEIDHPYRIGTPVWASYLGRDAWVGFESSTKSDFVSGHYRRLMNLEKRSFLFQPR